MEIRTTHAHLTCTRRMSDFFSRWQWVLAVQRGLQARPTWFVNHGSEMLGVGTEAGIEPAAEQAPRTTAAPSPLPMASTAGGVAMGGPGLAAAATASASAPESTAAGSGGTSARHREQQDLEHELFGSDSED
jgi:hypothetical protein